MAPTSVHLSSSPSRTTTLPKKTSEMVISEVGTHEQYHEQSVGDGTRARPSHPKDSVVFPSTTRMLPSRWKDGGKTAPPPGINMRSLLDDYNLFLLLIIPPSHQSTKPTSTSQTFFERFSASSHNSAKMPATTKNTQTSNSSMGVNGYSYCVVM